MCHYLALENLTLNVGPFWWYFRLLPRGKTILKDYYDVML
jgi:hypothetical protein